MWQILPEHVLGAMALLDDPVEGPRLREQLHFGPARSYRLLYGGRFYDSKAVVGIAHGLSPAGDYLTGGTPGFSGGTDGAATLDLLLLLRFAQLAGVHRGSHSLHRKLALLQAALRCA